MSRNPARPGPDRVRRRLARLLPLAAALLLVLALAACGDDQDGDDDAGAAASSAAAPASSAAPADSEAAPAGALPDTIRIGYQLIPNGDAIVRQLGWLEQALPGSKIEWLPFESGGDVNTAIAAGSLDLGLAGSSPVTRGLAPPLSLPYAVPWIFDVIGTNEALVATKDSGVTDVAGLAGKKVATPFASTAHYSLLAALEDAGVDASTVEIIDLQPQDILAAWERGDIDAAYVWTPVLAELRTNGTTLITSADLSQKGKTTADLAVVTRDFAERYPDAVKAWTEQQNRAVELYRTSPDEAAAAIATALNLTPEEALAQAKELVWLDASEQSSADYLGTPEAPGGLAGNLLSAAEFLKGQAALDAVPDATVFQGGIDGSYAAAVAAGS